jgi:hypothetical protein
MEIAAVYTAEVLAIIGSYAVVAVFARRPSNVDDRERRELPLLPFPSVSAVPEEIDLPGLPPVRAENVHISGVSALVFTALVGAVGATATNNVVPDPSRPVRGQLDVSGFVANVVAAVDPVIAVAASVGVSVQVVVVYRWYRTDARRDRLSAYVVMQRLTRIVTGYGFFGGVCYLLWSVLTAASVDAALPILGVFCLIKLYLEQRRVSGELHEERSTRSVARPRRATLTVEARNADGASDWEEVKYHPRAVLVSRCRLLFPQCFSY